MKMNVDTTNPTKKISAEKVILIFAALVFGAMSVYSAFFIPEVPPEIYNSGDISSEKPEVNIEKTDGKVNLNTARREELIEGIPGVGKKLAGRIVAYREAYGGFKNTEEIMNIKGIGEKLFEKIKDYISV